MKIFTNQNLNIDYYIIYINIYKNSYKLHFYKSKRYYGSYYLLLFIVRILFRFGIWFIFRFKIN